MKQQVD